MARFGASVRRVALEAAITKETASRALRRLRKEGWLKVDPCACGHPACRHLGTRPFHGSKGSTWTICVPLHLVVADTGGLLATQAPELSDDAFRTRALGESGWRILRSVADGEWHSRRDIAVATGLHRSTVRRRLQQMSACGAVEIETDGRRVRRGHAHLDAIARHFRTLHRGQEQRIEFQHQREQYQARLSSPPRRGALELRPVDDASMPKAS